MPRKKVKRLVKKFFSFKKHKKTSKLLKGKLGLIFLLLGSIIIIIYSRDFANFMLRSRLAFFGSPKLTLNNISLKSQVPVRIKIQRLRIDLPVVSQKVTQNNWLIDENKANYLVGSGVAGKGNIVIYGHANYEVFGMLLNIKLGDKIIITTIDKKQILYVVKDMKVVWPYEVNVIRPTVNETLTVYTCYGLLDSQRFVVVGQRIMENKLPSAQADGILAEGSKSFFSAPSSAPIKSGRFPATQNKKIPVLKIDEFNNKWEPSSNPFGLEEGI